MIDTIQSVFILADLELVNDRSDLQRKTTIHTRIHMRAQFWVYSLLTAQI